jgi:hypothetical protein
MPGLRIDEKERLAEDPAIRLEEPQQKKTKASTRKARTWEESFHALVAYKERHGDCDVPQRYRDDPALGTWVGNQRRGRFTKLSQEQRDRFDELGFDWETLQERLDSQWNKKFKKLKEYRRENLDCCVPQGYKKDPELGNWVSKQRVLHAQGSIRPDRQMKLEYIGFTWSEQREGKNDTSKGDEKWLESYNKLVDFSKEHKHCIVPNFYKKDKSLGRWVSKQRTGHAKEILPEHQKELLDELGFVWRIDKADADASLSQRAWDELFERLVEFKQTYGHVNVHRNFTKWGLGIWVSIQRTQGRKGRLDPRRSERLLGIGLNWGMDFDQRWNENFEKLKAFKKKYGHVRVAKTSPNVDDRQLAHWVRNQREFRDKGTLLPARKKELDAIGFVWIGKKRKRASNDADTRKDNDKEQVVGAEKDGTNQQDAIEPMPRLKRRQRNVCDAGLDDDVEEQSKEYNDGLGKSDSSDEEFEFEG